MSNLADRLKQTMLLQGISQAELARRVKTSQPTIFKILNDETRNPRNIWEIARALNVDMQWLKTGEGEQPDFAKIAENPTACESTDIAEITENEEDIMRVEVLDVEASAGFGAVQASDFCEEIAAVEYQLDTYYRLFRGYNAENIKLINVKGDSMEPTIQSGDLIFVDIGTQQYNGDGIYVFTFGDTLYVKRLQKAGDMILVISDNPFYEKWTINENNENNLKIHGKVLIGQSQQIKRFG